MPTGRTMRQLAEAVSGTVHGDEDVVVVDVSHTSTTVEVGTLFVAMKGDNVDGHEYVADAVGRGASAIAVEDLVDATVPTLEIDDTRAAAGVLAAEVHDHPSHEIRVVGVTGTNGKTTVTHFIDSILSSIGRSTGVIGTVDVKVGDHRRPAALTTPEATDFQRLLSEMRSQNVTAAAVEVSSHALEFGRVNGTRFNVAAFTNLSQDHLDFHGDMESYGRVKKRLFTDFEVDTAVINIDDSLGCEIAAEHTGNLVTIGLLGDVNYSDIESVSGGTRFTLTTPWGTESVEAPIVGDFNVANLATAVACCVAAGEAFDEVVTALAEVAQVPGRFEVVSGDDEVLVIVDYAHTPESVATAVDTGRGLTENRVIALVGAGGDRDRDKRPMMGQALAMADVAIVTTDNPRSEDPEAIVGAVASGVQGTKLVVEVDRRHAISRAIAEAEPGDVVLILGRGHEPHQQVAGEKLEFDDRVVARDAIAEARKSTKSRDQSGSMGA